MASDQVGQQRRADLAPGGDTLAERTSTLDGLAEQRMAGRKVHDGGIQSGIVRPHAREVEVAARQPIPQQHHVGVDPPAPELVEHRVTKQIRMERRTSASETASIDQDAIRRKDLVGIATRDPIGNNDSCVVSKELYGMAPAREAGQTEQLVGTEV